MDLLIKDQLFIVGGATSGFGRAIAERLVSEGASVIAIARNEEKLAALAAESGPLLTTLALDITQPGAPAEIARILGNRPLHGVVLNAGGPPAKTVLDTTMEDWDEAYRTVLRWKIELTHLLLPRMINAAYGRLLYIESASVKQPMENLVLSNSIRLAVVGYTKSLSQEIGSKGITVNVVAPGLHDTAAMDRVVKKKIEQTGAERDEVRQQMTRQTAVNAIGRPEDFASLASWLLSPHSRFITGQTISVDGGTVRGTMG